MLTYDKKEFPQALSCVSNFIDDLALLTDIDAGGPSKFIDYTRATFRRWLARRSQLGKIEPRRWRPTS
jgi:hypothetical protein